MADTLSPGQRAVAIISAMGRPTASQLVKHFRDDEREALLRTASSLPMVPMDTLTEVIVQFEEAFVAGTGATDNLANVEALLERKLIAVDQSARDGEVWSTLSELDADALVERFDGEPDQLVALAILRLAPASAAGMVHAMPVERGQRIVSLALAARSPVPEVLASVEAYLTAGEGDDAREGTVQVTAVLNELERDVAESLLSSPGLPEGLAAGVRSGLFMFEDVAKLADGDRTVLLDEVSGERLAEALTGLEGAMAEPYLAAISPRTRRMVEAQLASGPAPAASVKAARREVCARAISLARDDKIALPQTGA